MANDDINELIGRYATGSLTVDEQKRLFDAALDDQDLFEQIAQEQEMKRLLAEPGARDRLIRALEPPRRRSAWIFGVAATAALSAVLVVFLMRPAPKPQQVAILKNAPKPAETAAPKTPAADDKPAAAPRVDKPASAPQPIGVPQPVKQKTAAADEPARDASKDAERTEKTEKKAENKLEDRNELDQVAAAPPVAAPPAPATQATAIPAPAPSTTRAGEALLSPVQQFRGRPQNSPGGPRQAQQTTQQNNQQSLGEAAGGLSKASSAAVAETPAFGFHYSVETKGHLILIPAADGYLTVKSNGGAILFARKRVAAGIVIDLALPDAASSVSVAFAASALPLAPTPIIRTDPEGTVQGATRLAVEIRINHQLEFR